jgi:hypothetical protein
VLVGLGAAVLSCDPAVSLEFELELKLEKEDIECRVTISQLYFSRKTKYCGPDLLNFKHESISFFALQL